MPIARSCARRSWYGRRCCASSTASTRATILENSGSWCSIPPNDLCTSNPNAAQFRAAFLLCGRLCRRLADISRFGGPYDLEPLEHGFDFVIHLKTLSGSSPPEEAAMGGQPPLAGALALPFIPGKPFIDRIQRSDPELRRAPNRARATSAIEQDDVAPDDRRRLAVRAKLASKSRGGALDAADHELCQFGRHRGAVAERDNVVVVVVQTGRLAIGAPEFICEGRAPSGGHDAYPFGASASAARIRAHERMPL